MINIHENIKFKIIYYFCVSKFLQDKLESDNIKYKNIKKIMEEDKIELLYGDNDNYMNKLCEWIKKININQSSQFYPTCRVT